MKSFINIIEIINDRHHYNKIESKIVVFTMTVDLFFVDQKTRDQVPNEFGKTSKELEQDVQILSDWVKTQPHFPEIMGILDCFKHF